MIKMTITELILAAFFILLELVIAIPSVKWKLMNSTIVFNEDVYLCCYVLNTSSQRLTETTKWKVNNTLALYEGRSFKESKYKQLELENAFIMVIFNFTITDMNVSYSCSYGFSTYRQTLTMKDVTSYELQPARKFTITTSEISGKEARISILFREVYPFPECKMSPSVSDNTSISSLYRQKGIFLEVVVIFQKRFDPTESVKAFHIKCRIGTRIFLKKLNANTFATNIVKIPTYFLETFEGKLSLVLNGILLLILAGFTLRNILNANACQFLVKRLPCIILKQDYNHEDSDGEARNPINGGDTFL